MFKGKALRRALESSDAQRINAPVPLITDTTELITPALAHEMLRRNKRNRPIHWKDVEKYADIMARGEWGLHAQGVILDTHNDILSGQTRLWAVIYSDTPVYMRVSRGTPPEAATQIDRGRSQSSRDLASRNTGRRHAPTEASIARAYCALNGNTRPDTDVIATIIEVNAATVEALLAETKGVKKTRSVLMVLAAICAVADTEVATMKLVAYTADFADRVDQMLLPHTASDCWGKGAAFSLAMERVKAIVEGAASPRDSSDRVAG